VVDLADSTAYNMHDIEDGLTARMFEESELDREVALWRGARESVELRHPGFLESTVDRKLRIKRLTNELIKICINDLIGSSAERLAGAGIETAAQARDHAGALIGHSEAIGREVAQLSKFLYGHFYRHPHLEKLTRRAQATLRDLFEVYVERPSEMPPWYRQWVDRAGLQRSVCDYLAGMTDRFAHSEHERLVAGG
jgi:dGTPase